MQTAWTLCIYTWVEFSKWDSSTQCNSTFLCQVSICNLFLSNGWSMPVPSFNHCSYWWGYFQLPVTARNAAKTSLTEISAILKPEQLCSPPHPPNPFDHFWCGRASCHWWQGRFLLWKALYHLPVSTTSVPFRLEANSYPLLLGLQTLDFQQLCVSLQTQLNPNCPLHLGKDTSSPTEVVADLWTNWSHWFNKLLWLTCISKHSFCYSSISLRYLSPSSTPSLPPLG